MKDTIRTTLVASLMAASLVAGMSAAPEPQTSARMERAKDFIADEQWLRAIEALKAAAADSKEKSQDEALFWLAHSHHQAGNLGEAVATIAQLEQKFPASRWVKPARSLRVELAQKLRREDVLWWTVETAPPARRAGSTPAAPPTTAIVRMAPTPAAPAPPHSPRPAAASGPLPPEVPGTATPTPPPAAVVGVSPPRAAAGAGGRRPVPAPPMPMMWASEYTTVDNDLRIQALGSLIKTDAPRVIPILRGIALESNNTGEASRAVFVLAQSGRPDAHSTVLEVAKRASEPVSVAAVRELGRFGGPRVFEELLEVYETAKPRVKYQVVNSLGERAAANALFRIVQSESDTNLRDIAIVTLGRAGGREQLQRLYRRASVDAKRPIITGLFNARAEDELIEIAERERDETIRREVLLRLRLLGTAKAKQYLEKASTSR
jgi:hypothetical protein